MKDSNCEKETIDLFVGFISESSGEFQGKHLRRLFKNQYGKDIVFKNPVKVTELKEFVSKNLDLSGAVLTSLSSLYGKGSLNLSGNEAIAVECSSCSEPGEKNIKLKINQKTIWLSSTLKIERKGYRLTKDVSPFGEALEREAVEASTALDDGKSPLFHDIEKLRFYRPNKPLTRGKTLRTNDLSPRNLVKFNQNVDVLLKGKNVSLKTKATSRQNGRYGDTVKLYNPKTRKNLLGKVIDYNTVLVEL